MTHVATFIARHCRVLALVCLASLAVPAAFLPRMGIDNSIEVWLPQGSESLHRYKAFLNRFGSEEFIVVAATLEDPLSDAALALQERVAADLSAVDGVARVLSIPEMRRSVWSDVADWQTQARQSPILRNYLLGSDGRTVGLFVWLKRLDQPQARRRLVERIEQIVDTHRSASFDPHLAGTPLMNVTLDRTSQRAAATFLPLAVVASILVLAFVLRRPAAVVAPMLAAGGTVAWTIGLMAMTGRSMNMVTASLPALLFVLALSNGIHLASRFGAAMARLGDRAAATRETLHDLIRPSVFTVLTTAVGFGSLVISDMEPVTDLGVFAAAGMLIALVFNLAVIPGVMATWGRAASAGRASRVAAVVSRVGGAASRRCGLVAAIAVVLLAGCIVATTRIRTESNVLQFFPSDSTIARDYRFIGERLTGFYTVEFQVRTAVADEAAALAGLKRLREAVAARPDVARVDDYGQLAPLAMAGMFGPGGPARAALFRELAPRFRAVEGDHEVLRSSILVRSMNSSEFFDLLAFVRGQAQQVMPPATTWDVTGVVSLLNEAQQSLVQTQVESFAVAGAVVLAVIGLLFASLRVFVAAVLPNIVPVFMTFALMAITGIPLDPATVTVASVAIGIAVDNTIHFLSVYRLQRAVGLGPMPAAAATLAIAGQGMVFTSVVAAAGFSILCLADFKPVAYFGLLLAVTMLTALAADVIITPAMARWFNLWEKK